MRRRELMLLLSVAASVLPAAALPQPIKVYRIGVLTNTPQPDALEYLLPELRKLGYVEGRNLIVERRYSEGHGERWPGLAGELVALKVDAIVAFTTPAALAAKQATGTIPIVIPTAIDPVGAGLAASLARPGGNVTGGGILVPEVSAKALSLLKEAVPTITKVAVLGNAANPALALILREVEATARAAGISLYQAQVHEPQDFAAALAEIARERSGGLLLLNDSLVFQYQDQMVEFAVRERIPAVSTVREFAEAGGLMSYGPNRSEVFRIGANTLDRVLKGAKPADLPFEQPTEFELFINLKTAKTLGLTLPPLLLTRADEVIE
jgi:putative tryptophan/tyrosine transport system substrate-binding protein